MSEKFVASNGFTAHLHERGYAVVKDNDGNTYLTDSGSLLALRELFQHERDKELGRWRWPENPAYVGYRHPEGVWILDERAGFAQMYYPDDDFSAASGTRAAAAKAYFAAHPEPKPWHDAIDGHLWLIRFSDFPETDVSALVKGGCFIYNDHCHEGVAEIDDPTLVAARRIWPEVSDAE